MTGQLQMRTILAQEDERHYLLKLIIFPLILCNGAIILHVLQLWIMFYLGLNCFFYSCSSLNWTPDPFDLKISKQSFWKRYLIIRPSKPIISQKYDIALHCTPWTTNYIWGLKKVQKMLFFLFSYNTLFH